MKSIDDLNNLNVIVDDLNDKSRRYMNYKAIIDFLITIIFSIPILLIIVFFGLLVKIDSKGPMFYSQLRVGKNGKLFKIYKLRSMVVHQELDNTSTWTEENDPRITRVGKVIRKLRIDELPQFLNILKGEMSLIGPRPERPDLTKSFISQIEGFEKRLMVKPGITGLAQVNGGYDHTPEQKLEYDLTYINEFGFRQDLHIFFKTILVVLTGDGAR